VNFKISYTYCPQIVLAADITFFSASRSDKDNIDIKWITQNEKNSRKYEIQNSADGKTFRSIAEFVAAPGSTQTGTYRYPYQIQPSDNNKTLLFRIKQIETDGTSAAYNSVKY